jgi:hypothetical protein
MATIDTEFSEFLVRTASAILRLTVKRCYSKRPVSADKISELTAKAIVASTDMPSDPARIKGAKILFRKAIRKMCDSYTPDRNGATCVIDFHTECHRVADKLLAHAMRELRRS